MPLIPSSYQPPRIFRNPHTNTLYAALWRRVPRLPYQRMPLELPDGDVLDLDWLPAPSQRLVVLLHGLEGNTQSRYLRGMLGAFYRQGWAGLGVNFRSCGGQMNRTLRVYHSGETQDLQQVLAHVQSLNRYEVVVLIGFSLGGNVLLKYLGTDHHAAHFPELKAAVAISTPCELVSCSRQLDQHWKNRLYLGRFMRSLNRKLRHKLQQFPEALSLPEERLPRNFAEFDEWFTAPVHGYQSAMDYWTRASSLPDLEHIAIPCLLLNARDDTFLGAACYPESLAQKHPYLHLEVPPHGGHVGFVQAHPAGLSYAEQRALEFVQPPSSNV